MAGVKVATYGSSAEVYTYVEDFRWRKNGAFVAAVQTSTQSKPATKLFAILRTDRVYIDRNTIYLVYSAHDEEGSFRISQDNGFAVSFEMLQSGSSDVHSSGWCNSSSLIESSARYVDYCGLNVSDSSFLALTGDAQHSTQLSLLPYTGATALVRTTSMVTLTKPPSWFRAELRNTSTGLRHGGAPSGTTTGVFFTLPTHPVYAGNDADDQFDVIIFANDDSYAVYAWTLELQYDQTKVRFVSYEQSNDFAPVSVSTGTSDATGRTLNTFLTSAPSADGGTSFGETRRQGVFFMLAVRMRMLDGTAAGNHTDVITLRLSQMLNAGNNAFRAAESAQVFDARSDVASTQAQIEVVAVNNLGTLPFSHTDEGPMLQTHPINGVHATRTYGGTMVTDYALSALSSPVIMQTNLCSCSNRPEGAYPAVPYAPNRDFSVTVSGGNCVLTMVHEDVHDEKPFGILRAQSCSDSLTFGASSEYATFRVLELRDLTIAVDDSRLHLLHPFLGAANCDGYNEYEYQRTRVCTAVLPL
jgi:hypothetical protein